MPWFRKHKKILMASLVGFLMVAWGVLPTVSHFVAEQAEDYGDLLGRPISHHSFQRASMELDFISRAGFMQQTPVIRRFIMTGDLEEEEEPTEGRITGEAAWRYLMLTYLAEDADIQVSDTEVHEILGQLPPHLQDRNTYNAIKNWMAIAQLTTRTEESYGPRQTDLWMEYVYENREVNIQYAKVEPEIFKPLIEVTEEEIHAFYEEHKETRPDPDAGIPGYFAPERVMLEYTYPDLDAVKQTIEVAEEEIQNYYEENKEDFIKEEIDDEEDVIDEVDDTPTEEDQGEENETQEENNQPTADGGDEEENGKEDPRYKPLTEVREEIEEIIVSEKAQEKVEELALSVMEALDALPTRPGRPLNMQQVAGRFERRGVRYERPEGQYEIPYLSREEITESVPAGTEVAQLVFDQELDIGFTERVEGPDGPVIIQVRERKEPSPEPFERVADHVKEDLIGRLSMERAAEFTDTLKNLVREKGFREAAEAGDKKIVEQLGRPANEESGDLENENDREEQEAEERPELYYLSIAESGFISKRNPQIEGEDRTDIVRKALNVPTGDVFVAKDYGPSPASFVIEKSEEREADPDGFASWMQNRKWMEYQNFMMAAMQQRPLNPEDWTSQQKMVWHRLQGLLGKNPPPSILLN